MPMLLLLLAITLAVAALVMLVRSPERVLGADDLGNVSERWLSEQRAASYELHR